MTEVKWIKLSTTMFEDEKIRLIESMPEADTLLVIWIKLLAQAGKTNASGYIYLNENIPYTDEMLSTIFNRPLLTVRMALQVFRQYGMIDIDEIQRIAISNWAKHQSVSGLDKIREDTRKRVAAHRERKKQQELPYPGSNVTSNDDVTDIEEEKEEEEEEEKEKENKKNSPDLHQDHTPSNIHIPSISNSEDKHSNKLEIPYEEIVSYLNHSAGTQYKASSKKTQGLIKARWNEGFRLDAFKRVIDNKVAEWLNNPEMEQYLRPVTLFGTKFGDYYGQRKIRKGGLRNGSTQSSGDPDFEYIGL